MRVKTNYYVWKYRNFTHTFSLLDQEAYRFDTGKHAFGCTY